MICFCATSKFGDRRAPMCVAVEARHVTANRAAFRLEQDVLRLEQDVRVNLNRDCIICILELLRFVDLAALARTNRRNNSFLSREEWSAWLIQHEWRYMLERRMDCANDEAIDRLRANARGEWTDARITLWQNCVNWLDQVELVVDRFHYRNHNANYCRKFVDPHKCEALRFDDNTEAAESAFSWLARSKHIFRTMIGG